MSAILICNVFTHNIGIDAVVLIWQHLVFNKKCHWCCAFWEKWQTRWKVKLWNLCLWFFSGLQNLLCPVLAALLESKSEHAMTFEGFFDQVSTIRQKSAVFVFNLIDFSLLHIYCDPDTRSAFEYWYNIYKSTSLPNCNMFLLPHLRHHVIFDCTFACLPLLLPISYSVSINLPKGYVFYVFWVMAKGSP